MTWFFGPMPQNLWPPYFLEQLILTNRYQGFDPRKLSQEPLGPLGTKFKNHYFWHKCFLLLDHFHSVSFWHTQKRPCSIYLPIFGPPRLKYMSLVLLEHYGCLSRFCRSLIKVKFFIDQVRPALGVSWLLVGWLSPCSKKPQNCPFSEFFNLAPKYFLPYCLILT